MSALLDSATIPGAAISYAAHGWPVHPVNRKTKAPSLRGDWRAQSTTDPIAIREFFRTRPDANIGVPTGAPSGAMVIDIDPRHGGSSSWEALVAIHGELPETATSETRGDGRHYVLRIPKGMHIPSFDLAPGVQVLGEGKQFVAPPSRHESGHVYRWLVPPDKIADAPQWLLDLLIERSSQRNSSFLPSGGGGVLLTKGLSTSYCGSLGPGEDAGGRDGKGRGRDPLTVQRALSVLGITAKIGRRFRCVLPGHEEEEPSAAVWRSPTTGIFNYHDFHRGDHRDWFSLPEVFEAQVNRRVTETLPPSTHAYWWDRLWFEAELLAVDVPTMLLPPGTRPALAKVARGFALLHALRTRRDPGEPIPFTAAFAASWCGVAEVTAKRAIRELRDFGVMHRETKVMAGGRPLNLYTLEPSSSQVAAPSTIRMVNSGVLDTIIPKEQAA